LLGFRLEPYHRSIRKRQLQSPKFYLFDIGVKRAMDRSLVNQILPSTGEYGDAFEHFIICEIVKLINLKVTAQYKIYYLRTNQGAEMDLIVDRPGMKTLCIEIESSENVSNEHIKKLVL